MALILDTGALYTALDRSDADHAACRRMLEAASEPLVVPAPVLVEVEYWTQRRLGTGAWLALLEDIDAGAFVGDGLAPEPISLVYGRDSPPPPPHPTSSVHASSSSSGAVARPITRSAPP